MPPAVPLPWTQPKKPGMRIAGGVWHDSRCNLPAQLANILAIHRQWLHHTVFHIFRNWLPNRPFARRLDVIHGDIEYSMGMFAVGVPILWIEIFFNTGVLGHSNLMQLLNRANHISSCKRHYPPGTGGGVDAGGGGGGWIWAISSASSLARIQRIRNRANAAIPSNKTLKTGRKTSHPAAIVTKAVTAAKHKCQWLGELGSDCSKQWNHLREAPQYNCKAKENTHSEPASRQPGHTAIVAISVLEHLHHAQVACLNHCNLAVITRAPNTQISAILCRQGGIDHCWCFPPAYPKITDFRSGDIAAGEILAMLLPLYAFDRLGRSCWRLQRRSSGGYAPAGFR